MLRAWLTELNRAAAPGGYLLLSVHGVEDAERTKLKEPYLSQLNTEGFILKTGANFKRLLAHHDIVVYKKD
jgi:hypothetical protein